MHMRLDLLFPPVDFIRVDSFLAKHIKFIVVEDIVSLFKYAILFYSTDNDINTVQAI